MEFKKLSEIARIEISGVDKKIKEGEKSVRLCNFTDVYYNWDLGISDSAEALLAVLQKPSIRLSVAAVELRVRTIGRRLGIEKPHSRKFRCTLTTKTTDKGAPIEQLQASHRKYMGQDTL